MLDDVVFKPVWSSPAAAFSRAVAAAFTFFGTRCSAYFSSSGYDPSSQRSAFIQLVRQGSQHACPSTMLSHHRFSAFSFSCSVSFSSSSYDPSLQRSAFIQLFRRASQHACRSTMLTHHRFFFSGFLSPAFFSLGVSAFFVGREGCFARQSSLIFRFICSFPGAGSFADSLCCFVVLCQGSFV